MVRIVWVALLGAVVSVTVLAAPPPQGPAVDALATADQVFTEALRQSVGAPARADLGDQATVRLDGNLLVVPKDIAARLLTVGDHEVPPDFIGLLIGDEGMQAPGMIRFVPSGFVDSDAALHWTNDDFLASLRDTVEHANAARVAAGAQPREVRGWTRPPLYDPESHQMVWATMTVPQGTPRDADGTVTFTAIGFGRSGYIELTVVTSAEKADVIARMVKTFLAGLTFRPGHGYAQALPGDARAPAGLAGAMGIESLHKAESTTGLFASDLVMPVAGGIVAAIGAISLLLYIQRHMRRESRRL